MKATLRVIRLPISAWVICVLAVSTPGCSLFADSHATLTVTASDPAAQIWIDGTLYGTGTVQAVVARDEAHSVMARVGDRVAVRPVGRSISTTGILDIVGGVLFLFPLLGLLGAGFWDVEADHVDIAIPAAPAP